MVAVPVVFIVASILDNHREQYWCKYCDGSNNFIYCIPQSAVVVATVFILYHRVQYWLSIVMVIVATVVPCICHFMKYWFKYCNIG